jgi:hypothetical protein
MRRLRLFLVFIVFIAIFLPRASVAGQCCKTDRRPFELRHICRAATSSSCGYAESRTALTPRSVESPAVWLNYSRNLMRRGSPAAASEPPQAFREWRLSAEYEWHPKKLVDDQMRDIYGRHRANLGAAYATRGVPWCKRAL